MHLNRRQKSQLKRVSEMSVSSIGLCADLCEVSLKFPAEITQPFMNIHNVEVMLSAHHLCIFSSNLQRQLNETLLKAGKNTTSCTSHKP